MFGWEVEEREQLILILGQRLHGLGIAGTILLGKVVDLFQSARSIRGAHDLVQHLFGSGLQALGQLVEHIGDLVYPTALFLGFRIDVPQRTPEAQGAISNRQYGGRQASALQISE